MAKHGMPLIEAVQARAVTNHRPDKREPKKRQKTVMAGRSRGRKKPAASPGARTTRARVGISESHSAGALAPHDSAAALSI